MVLFRVQLELCCGSGGGSRKRCVSGVIKLAASQRGEFMEAETDRRKQQIFAALYKV